MLIIDSVFRMACDVDAFSDRSSGVLDVGLHDYEAVFGVKLGMNKQERLLTEHSSPTHAMGMLEIIQTEQ